MSRKLRNTPLDGLPPELAELDRELAALELDERPSFGPELRNELARKWPGVRHRRGHGLRRYAAAAAVAGVALAAVLVPPVRAALSDGVQRLVEAARPDGGVLDEMEVVVVPLADRPASGGRPGVVALQPEEDGSPVVVAAPEEEAPAPRMPAFQPGTSTPPRVRNPEAAQSTVRSFYPRPLQDARIGGTASVLLWVRENGSVSSAEVARSSGLAALDDAARSAASALRFEPARRNGVPIGTWVEFDIVFDPTPADARGVRTALGGVPVLDPAELLPSWSDAGAVPAPVQLEAREMLRVAMGADRATVESVYGPLDGILQGVPPAGADPESWRRAVTMALDDARIRDPENPAPYLAQARIRRNEGRRSAAWNLFQEGYRRALRGVRPVSPGLTAELSYESGRIAREHWLAWRGLRDFAPRGPGEPGCPDPGPTTEVSAGLVQAWNFNCASALSSALVAGAGTVTREEDLRREMVRYFTAAAEARPGHVGANTELLLLLAEAGEWEALLDGALEFGQRTTGHPHALLLEGLALARTGRPVAAADRFQAVLERLPEDAREALSGAELARRSGTGWAARGEEAGDEPVTAESLWLHLDPVLSTPVNERLVEHWARAAHAWLRFGDLETDAARTWLRFGEPRGVRSVATDSGLRLELWSYGTGPALAFLRPAYAEAGALTAEARSYLRGLEDAGAARRFGRPLPAPEVLDARLVETAAALGNGTDLQIRFPLPAGPGAGPALRVGVFLLGFDGTPVRVERWQVERDAGRVELTVPMDPQVREAVVELYDPASGAVSAARTPVSLEAAGQD